MEHDEIYLIDLWRILRREWRWLVGVLVVVLAAAVFYAQAAHPRWEAVAWIRPGQLGAFPAGEDPRAEPFQRVIERMQTRAFQDDVLRELDIDPRSREAHLYRGSFDLDPSPYAGLLKLTVRGYSAQQAKRFVEVTYDHLRQLHEGLMAEPLHLAEARLRQVQAQLQDATTERDRLRRAIAPGGAVAGQNRQDLLLASMVLNNSNQEVRGLQQTVSDLKARLTTSYSYQTSLAWPVYVPDHSVYPNRVLIWGAGLVLGLGLGTMAAIARNARRRMLAMARLASTAPIAFGTHSSSPATPARGSDAVAAVANEDRHERATPTP